MFICGLTTRAVKGPFWGNQGKSGGNPALSRNCEPVKPSDGRARKPTVTRSRASEERE